MSIKIDGVDMNDCLKIEDDAGLGFLPILDKFENFELYTWHLVPVIEIRYMRSHT